MGKPRNLIVRQLFPTPDPPAPTKMRCVSVYIPDSMDHLAAFAGALALLGKWNSWQKDDAHSATLAAFAWQQCLLLGIRDCETSEPLGGYFMEDFMTMGFRVDPDNNCILQAWCIDHWETFWDISPCIGVNVRQAVDGAPIPAGDCRSWDVVLNSWDKWLLPVAVNEGDTITVTLAQGATNDGAGLAWRCPSGEYFVLNACTGGSVLDGSDPAPLVAHQKLIMSVDGSFYDGYNTVLSVPSGVSDGQVFFQMNTATLIGNAGSITFHVELCSRQDIVEPITMTYLHSSGLASMNAGEYLTINSGCCGGGGGLDNAVHVQFNRPVKITVVSQTAFNLVLGGCGAGCLWSNIQNPAGTLVSTRIDTDPHDPLTLPPHVGVIYELDSIASGTNFSVTLHIEEP